MLALDLGVFHRRPHVVRMREALAWTGVWITLALVFNAGIAWFWGAEAGLEFLTGYLVEKSLSMDNVFVFLLIFGYFNTPPAYQHKVLFWGIIGAIVFRSIFIVAGLAVLEAFHWSMYAFGAFLLATGCWMMRKKDERYEPQRNPLIRLFQRYAPLTGAYHGDRFFARKDGRWMATPLFVVLLAVESSDIVFAVDSIPAIFAVTQNHFIVYTSNIFAMLGLRAMYFAVAGFMRSFHYLHYGFAAIIIVLGVKMLLSGVYHVPVAASLVLIVLILMASMIASLLRPRAEDLKQILQRAHRLGVLPFRRLLLLEKVFRLGTRLVRDAMRARPGVRVLQANAPWPANRAIMIETRLSRYPVVDGTDAPIGIVHLKDLFTRDARPEGPDAWRTLVRPAVTTTEDAPLEDLLVTLQTQRQSLALVFDRQARWTGVVTFQDVVEELVGKGGDEFEAPALPLPALTQGGVTLDLEASTIDEAVARMMTAARSASVSRSSQRTGPDHRLQHSYLGNGVLLAARLDASLDGPMVLFGRSGNGVPVDIGTERASLLFLFLLPPGVADTLGAIRDNVRSLMESEYLRERLLQADRPEVVVDALREGVQVGLA
jgi:tellurite resistance protein TerC